MRNRDLAADHVRRADARLRALDVLFDARSWADVVRESQEVVELALKGLLREYGVDPPRIHDVADVLLAERTRLPPVLHGELERLAAVSRALRRDRELAFYGAEDLTPSDFYKRADAVEARDWARLVVSLVKPHVLPASGNDAALVMKGLIIAIDGPSGAGKGTISRTISEQLGYRHIDTGAMYRAVGWKANHDGIPLDDEERVASLATRAEIIVEGGVVSIDGHDVTKAIRTPEIDTVASVVARLPKVRDVLVARQRELGRQGGVVMEGRDIGTVVFPNADVKIYLDASAEERARRRATDAAHAGSQAGQAAVAEAIQARDASDTMRAVSPLTLAPDAVHIDTTGMPIPAVVERVMELVRRKP